MKRFIHSLLILLAAALPAVVAAGCVELLDPNDPKNNPNAQELTIRIYLPVTEAPKTKVTDGPVTAKDNENLLHDVQIWAFTHPASGTVDDNEPALAYASVGNVSASALGGVLEVSMYIPDKVMQRPASKLKFDFYVLGNARSLGMNLTDAEVRTLTRGALKESGFGDDSGSGFGTSIVSAVPDRGLPMSCFFDNGGEGFDLSFLKLSFSPDQMIYMRQKDGETYDKQADDFVAQHFTEAQTTFIEAHGVKDGMWDWNSLYGVICPEMTLTRAVVKMRFVFAKTAGMVETTQILGLKLGDYSTATATGLIPDSTYVFPRENPVSGQVAIPVSKVSGVTEYSLIEWTGTTPGGATTPNPLLDSDDIGSIDSPLRLRNDSDIASSFVDAKGETKTLAPANMTADMYEQFLDYEISRGNASEKMLYVRESDKTVKCLIEYKVDSESSSVPLELAATGDDTTFHRNTVWTVYVYFTSDTHALQIQVSVAPWNGYQTSSLTESHL